MSINTRIFVKLSAHTWFVLSVLAVTGQSAWAIENSWFNPFVFYAPTSGSLDGRCKYQNSDTGNLVDGYIE